MSAYDSKNDTQHNVQSFLHLHSTYQHRIYGFIMSFVADWNEADDIFQETTSVLWEKFNEFEPETDFLAWALQIARFKILSFLKRGKIRKKHFSQETLDNLNEVAVSSVKDPELSLEALRNCVTKLPERSKKLLSLRYEEGATVSRIADRFQQSVHTLYKEYQKIHTQLFDCMRKYLAWN